MNNNERELKKTTAGEAVQSINPRRRWWRGLGNGAAGLLMVLSFILIADLVSGWNRDAQPLKETIQSAILCISAACAAGEFLAQWGRLLKSYCFARAETAEQAVLP